MLVALTFAIEYRAYSHHQKYKVTLVVFILHGCISHLHQEQATVTSSNQLGYTSQNENNVSYALTDVVGSFNTIEF